MNQQIEQCASTKAQSTSGLTHRQQIIRINPNDNVVVALRDVAAGEQVDLDDNLHVRALENIPRGHKMAVSEIARGRNVVKYGMSIGHATTDIAAGSWVHTHNMATNLSGESDYSYHPHARWPEPTKPETFMGFRRPNGQVGIRNEVWIIPTVGCVNTIARTLAEQNADLATGTVDGIYAFAHPFGCSQTGADHAQTRKLLASLVRHPNAGAVLVLSLGCENLTHEQFVKELGPYDPERVRFLTCQDVEDEYEAGAEVLAQLCAYAGRFHREPIPANELVVGLKCGGSDGLSGITANPTIGRVTDALAARGGTAVLSEVPEMFGAEDFLLGRCVSQEVFDQATAMLRGFKDYFVSHGEVVYDNPSPGNKRGGITTLEDKSCGCVQKGGMAPITGVVPYAGQVHERGLNLVCSPGNDLVSTTALTAAGCHLILFSTGRGTPFGAPAPTLKISTNTPLYQHKRGWIDFDAGVVATGQKSLDQTGADLWKLVLDTASGRATTAERHGMHEISIWKDGVVL